jgi:excisionase family DNA binding protein
MTELYYSTADLSEMMQVGKSTIKRWTEEGKLRCFRTPGGHRKFKSSEVHRFLTNYKYEISPSYQHYFSQHNNNSQLPEDDNSASIADQCITNAIKNHHAFLEQHLKSAFLRCNGVAELFDLYLTPLLKQLNAKYLQKNISTVEFQIAKSAFIHALITVTSNIPRLQENNIEMYCLSVNEGMNEVELKAVELLLDHIGFTVYNLGTVLTKYAAQDIVNQCKPEDVFVVLSLDDSSGEIIRQFNALATGITSYGGNVFTSNFFNDSIAAKVESKEVNQFYSFAEIVVQFTQTKVVA